MKRYLDLKIFFMTVMFFLWPNFTMAYDINDAHQYPYFSEIGQVFPEDSWISSYTDSDGVYHDLNYWADTRSFGQRQCTSYAAYMISLEIENFSNSFLVSRWGHGKDWNDAASSIGIKVDKNPIPGDIAYWEELSDYGHVAYVEKVHYDENGVPETIDITEYNYSGTEEFGKRENLSVTNPDGFIHILAYYEDIPEGHSFYLDRYEMFSLVPEQTQEEWARIFYKVWKEYRCTTCSSNDNIAYLNAIEYIENFIGLGGGEDPDSGTTDPTPDIDVHIDKVTASYQGDENYEHETTIYLGQEVRMEVDIENKGDEDIHVDIEYFWDDDKSFSFDDSHKVGEDNDVKIDHGTRDNGQPENVIEHKQHIYFSEVGTYYLYIKVTTSGDSDESASSNTREYAKVIVTEFIGDPIPNIEPTGKSWDELTPGEKAAVLLIIFD